MYKKIIVLFFALFLIGCQEALTTDFENTNLQIQEISALFRERTLELNKYYNGMALMPIHVIIDENDSGDVFVPRDETVVYPLELTRDDYLEKYNQQSYDFVHMDTIILSLMMGWGTVNMLLEAVNYHKALDNVEIDQYILNLGYVTYKFNLRDDNYIYLQYKSTIFSSNYLLGINENGLLDFTRVYFDNDTGEVIGYSHFVEDEFFQEQTFSSSTTYSYRYFDLVSGNGLIYQNEDGTSFYYYDNEKSTLYFEDDHSKGIEYNNDQSTYFSFYEEEDQIKLKWELLEVTGWDRVIVNEEGYLHTILELYSGETERYIDHFDDSLSSLNPYWNSASLVVYKNIEKEDLTNSLIQLTDFGLVLKDTSITIDKIYQDMEYAAQHYHALLTYKGVLLTSYSNMDFVINDINSTYNYSNEGSVISPF